MGIGQWLLGLGVRTEQTAEYLGTRKGTVPLHWPAGTAGSVIYRLPRDPAQRASTFSTIQTIVVNEGELAVVLEDGRALGALEPGRYVFEKARVVGSLDVIWMKSGQIPLKWGIGNISSADGIQINANGMVYVRVADGNVFNSEVVQGQSTLGEVELQRYLMPRLQGVIRSTLALFEALSLQTQRATFSDAVKENLDKTFAAMGVGIVDFEVIEVNFPPEFKAIIAQATMVTHGSRAAIIEAQAQSQIRQLEAVAEANAQLTAGIAQVEVFKQLQAQGIDPLKLKAMDALNTLAANPAQGAMMGGDAARAALFGSVAGAALAQGGSAVVPAPAPQLAPAVVQQAPTAPAQPAESSTAGPSREDLERQLDNLTERLSEGHVSEETYNKLSARIEAKLAKLDG